MTPTCYARPHGACQFTGHLAGTGPHTTALLIAALTLILAGALLALPSRPNGRHQR